MITRTDTSGERGPAWGGGGVPPPPSQPHFWLQSERVGSPGTFQRNCLFYRRTRAFITSEPNREDEPEFQARPPHRRAASEPLPLSPHFASKTTGKHGGSRPDSSTPRRQNPF